MNLDSLKDERKAWLKWKNIAPLVEKIEALPEVKDVTYEYEDTFTCSALNSNVEIYSLARDLMPWRKGPFNLFGLFIDTEWRSFIKYNLLEKHFDIEGKVVGDIGCNNGYYMFRMLKHKPKKLVGFDPSAHYMCQFNFINHFVKSDIVYELLGVEHLPYYEHKFDVLFCLGVLYHRSDPVATLKALFKGLNENGELFLDTFMIDGDESVCLTPLKTYSKIPNTYFVPTIKALENWGLRAGFKKMELLHVMKTDTNEQRKTDWIEGESLGEFLDPNDETKTIEGYPAPKRAYVKFLTKE